MGRSQDIFLMGDIEMANRLMENEKSRQWDRTSEQGEYSISNNSATSWWICLLVQPLWKMAWSLRKNWNSAISSLASTPKITKQKQNWKPNQSKTTINQTKTNPYKTLIWKVQWTFVPKVNCSTIYNRQNHGATQMPNMYTMGFISTTCKGKWNCLLLKLGWN